jgi:hypothetical protein
VRPKRRTEHLVDLVRCLDPDRPWVVDVQRIPTQLGHGRLLANTRGQPCPSRFERADVARDPDDARQPAVGVVVRGVGDPGRHQFSIGPPGVVAARPGLAGLDALHDLGGLRLAGLGDRELADLATLHLARRPAVQLLGGRVPVHDRAAEVGRDHRLSHRIQQL